MLETYLHRLRKKFAIANEAWSKPFGLSTVTLVLVFSATAAKSQDISQIDTAICGGGVPKTTSGRVLLKNDMPFEAAVYFLRAGKQFTSVALKPSESLQVDFNSTLFVVDRKARFCIGVIDPEKGGNKVFLSSAKEVIKPTEPQLSIDNTTKNRDEKSISRKSSDPECPIGWNFVDFDPLASTIAPEQVKPCLEAVPNGTPLDINNGWLAKMLWNVSASKDRVAMYEAADQCGGLQGEQADRLITMAKKHTLATLFMYQTAKKVYDSGEDIVASAEGSNWKQYENWAVMMADEYEQLAAEFITAEKSLSEAQRKVKEECFFDKFMQLREQ